MIYLLDTTPCVAYLRNKNAPIRVHLNSHPAGAIGLCSIVIGELLFGAEKSSNAAKNLLEVEAFIRPFASLPFDDDAAREYSRIRLDLESRGIPIGDNDLLIAAIALAESLTLETHNINEFSRVPGLALEDWESP